MSHSLVRTSPFYTSPFCRLPVFGTFPHVVTHFQCFSASFLQDFFLELRGFTTVLVQRDEKRPKENKKRKTKPFCTLVVAPLSSSDIALLSRRSKRSPIVVEDVGM